MRRRIKYSCAGVGPVAGFLPARANVSGALPDPCVLPRGAGEPLALPATRRRCFSGGPGLLVLSRPCERGSGLRTCKTWWVLEGKNQVGLICQGNSTRRKRMQGARIADKGSLGRACTSHPRACSQGWPGHGVLPSHVGAACHIMVPARVPLGRIMSTGVSRGCLMESCWKGPS